MITIILFTFDTFLPQETAPWLGRVATWLTPTDQMSGQHIARQSEEGDLVCNNFDNIDPAAAGDSRSSAE